MILKNKILIILAGLFFLPGLSFSQENKKVEPLSLKFVNNINVPDEIGILKETFIPEGTEIIKELIIYIQDAHCHYEAQMNIAKIVRLMIENYGVKLANVEGTAGLIDTKPFSAFNDRKVKMDFAEYFMKQGKITGPEYLSITSDLEFTIFGIENEDLYAENYTAYMNTMQYRDKVNAYTQKLIQRLNALKLKLFSPELLELDNKSTDYEEKRLEFADYATYLEDFAEKKKVDLTQFKNFILQAKARKLEQSIDFKKVEEQRTSLIEEFGKILSNNKKEMDAIIQKSFAFKMREIDARTYYNFLTTTAKTQAIDPSKTKIISQYTDYLNYYHEIDKNNIVDEIVLVEKHLKKTLYTSPDVQELDHLSYIMRILNLLFRLEVLKNDYLYFKTHKTEFQFIDAKKFIQKLGPQYNIFLGFEVDNDLVTQHIRFVENFYDAALKRDLILVENTLNRMKEEKTDRCILITGGFHTEGLARILREQKKCFLLFAPKITDINAKNPYEEVMKAQADSVKGYGGIQQ